MFQEFNPVDRANLLDDAFNLAHASHIDYSIALNLAKYLPKEIHYIPWKNTIISLNYIGNVLYGHAEYHLWLVCMKQAKIRYIYFPFG